MKKWISFFLILFAFSLTGQAQPGFNKVYHQTPSHAPRFLDVLSDLDTLVGIYGDFDTLVDHWGVFLFKLDTFGNILQSTVLSDTTGNHNTGSGGNKIIKTSDGGYAFSANYSGGGKNVFFVKYNHNLEKEFIRYFPLDSDMVFETAPIVKQLANGDYLMYILYIPDDGGILYNFAIKLLRLKPNGDIKWEQKFMEVDTSMIIYKILKLDSNYLLVGSKGQYNSISDIVWYHSYAFIIDSLGNKTWEWESTENEGGIFAIQPTDDGGYLCSTAKLFVEPDTWNQVMGIRKVNSLFQEEWSHFIDVTPSQFGGYLVLQPTPDGNFVACGDLGTPYDSMPTIHTKISDEGEVIWERLDFAKYEDAQAYRHTVRGGTVLSSGSTVTCGSVWIDKPYGYSEKGWLIKISSEGCIDSLGCWPVGNTDFFDESQKVEIYPNPVNEELVVEITYSSPNAYICFYDLMGRLLRKQKLSQQYNQLNVSDLPKGILFYTVNKEQRIIDRGKLIKN